MNKRKLKRFLLSFKGLFIFFSALVLLANFVLFRFNSNNDNGQVDLSQGYTNDKYGIFLNEYVPVPAYTPSYLAKGELDKMVLGDANPSNKHIYVDLTNQRLYAYEGDRLIYNFLISSGKWGKTPTGDFKMWVKLKYTRMSGGNKALRTYYNLPNVPFTMYFYNSEIPKSRGYALHGAYWHNNFGHPMSHGCVNIRPDEAEKLFYWAEPPPSDKNETRVTDGEGTPITIYGTAPLE